MFGLDIAARKDRVVVGAPHDDDNGEWSGSASHGTLAEKITASDPSPAEYFGRIVDVVENIVALGAPCDANENGSFAGSVYLFTIYGEFILKIFAPDGQAGDYFGIDVSIQGNAMVVGAFGDDYIGPRSGTAYLYFI